MSYDQSHNGKNQDNHWGNYGSPKPNQHDTAMAQALKGDK